MTGMWALPIDCAAITELDWQRQAWPRPALTGGKANVEATLQIMKSIAKLRADPAHDESERIELLVASWYSWRHEQETTVSLINCFAQEHSNVNEEVSRSVISDHAGK